MTKEELKQKAKDYANNKADKGNYDYAVGDNVYFCKSALEQAYIAGAEPREKRIAELEDKLTEETAQRIYNFNKSIEWKEKHRDLEKENAELKNKIRFMGKQIDNLKAITRYDQLTKATEIIKKLYAVYYAPCVTESDLKYRDELFAEIKQFLSEVEK